MDPKFLFYYFYFSDLRLDPVLVLISNPACGWTILDLIILVFKAQDCLNLDLCVLKGIVQRELTGVETRVKRCALINYLVGNIYFFKLKGHHQERSVKPVSAA